MTDWKIYYDDGETIGSLSASPEQVRARGVLAIVQTDVANQYRILTNDYYLWDSSVPRWYGADMFGLWDYLCRPGWKRVLFGRSVTEREFEEVYADAESDPLFEAKTGFRNREHTPLSEQEIPRH